MNLEQFEELGFEEKANEFLKMTKTELVISFLGCETNELWSDTAYRNVYSVVLKNENHEYKFKFWDSIANTKKGIKKVQAYDILSCMEKYDVGSFVDFCSDFGYDIESCTLKESRNIEKTYKLVIEEYNALCKLFDDEEMEYLREIN